MSETKTNAWTRYDFSKGMPNEDTLRRWRVAARRLAKEAGAFTSCDLCKRPINGKYRYAALCLRPGAAWSSRLKCRKVCRACYITLDSIVNELEAFGARDHLPPESFVDAPEKEAKAVAEGLPPAVGDKY